MTSESIHFVFLFKILTRLRLESPVFTTGHFNMQKILGYIALAIIAIVGLHQVMQINNVSDAIAESNRKTNVEMAERKAKEQASEEAMEEEREYASESYGVPEQSEFSDSSDEEAVE
jgi:cellobiose-specific phosphotransferase system component IIC